MTIPVTCHLSLVTRLLIAGVFFLSAVMVGVRAQQSPGGSATNFNTVEYYDAPHERQVKSRLSGAEAVPQPGGLLVIKRLRLETFESDGKREIAATAPECVFDTLKGTASSPGRLQVEYGEGKFHVDGEGFLWRQNDSFLTISNNVRTAIESQSGTPATKGKP